MRPGVQIQLGQGGATDNPGAIHHPVDSPQLFGNLLHHPGNARRFGQIDMKADAPHFRRDPRKVLGHIQQGDMGAIGDENFGRGLADARCAPGHDDLAAAERRKGDGCFHKISPDGLCRVPSGRSVVMVPAAGGRLRTRARKGGFPQAGD